MFGKFKRTIDGNKVYLVSAVAVISAIIGWAAGEITLVEAVSAILVASGGAGYRSAMKKGEPA